MNNNEMVHWLPTNINSINPVAYGADLKEVINYYFPHNKLRYSFNDVGYCYAKNQNYFIPGIVEGKVPEPYVFDAILKNGNVVRWWVPTYGSHVNLSVTHNAIKMISRDSLLSEDKNYTMNAMAFSLRGKY